MPIAEGVEGVQAIQGRIAQIQSRFNPSPPPAPIATGGDFGISRRSCKRRAAE